MKRKKILALLVSAVMAVGVIGCGSGGSDSGSGDSGSSDGELIKVGIITMTRTSPDIVQLTMLT